VLQDEVGADVELVGSDFTAAELLKRELGDGGGENSGRITHFVTGDTLAYQHTAQVIGGVDGDIHPLDVTKLAALQRV
jgi:hypothetical protein